MSTEYNNTSDWTLEDCQSYINILYANRTSSFKERKAKAFFNSQTKKNRKTTITNDGIYVDDKPVSGGGEISTYNRMEHFTSLTEGKNPITYERQYVDKVCKS